MPQDDKALLKRLDERGVEFVIIGGVCGILHGTSLVTLDLDVCCRFSAQNLRQIEAALADLHPRHRLTPPKLPFVLTDELIGRLKNLYLETDFGVLDCLSEVVGVGGYDLVFANSVETKLSFGKFRMLTIEALIKSKEALGRGRDLEAVRQLRAIREKRD